jgi:hypothetical protein
MDVKIRQVLLRVMPYQAGSDEADDDKEEAKGLNHSS